MENSRKRLLMFISEDWYFLSHRLPIARAARDAGMDVYICARYRERLAEVEAEGLKAVPVELSRGGRNIFKDASVIGSLIQIYRAIKPDIAHHVALKPSIYGTIAARMAGTPLIINAMAGLGHIFTCDQPVDRVARLFVGTVFRGLFNSPRIKMLFQNEDDQLALTSRKAVRPSNCVIIRGSGVDTGRFAQGAEEAKDQPPMVALVSRMLWTKGVEEFVEAARRIKLSGAKADFVLVGESDPENPAAIPAARLSQWASEGMVKWWGRREDIDQILRRASVFVFPSYREGLPKSLLEAASAGLPLVAFDVPGCREVVKHGRNGFLVPFKDVDALTNAVQRLVEDEPLRRKMGEASRQIALAEFDEKIVVRQVMDLYQPELRKKAI